MPPRFYVPEARGEPRSIELPEDEAAHLTRVLRLAPGDRVRVFNGRGEEWDAAIDHAHKQRVTVTLGAAVTPAAEARLDMTLCVAALKGDKMDDVVRDAVMLGVRRIRPLITERTEWTRAALDRSARVARWQRIAIASAKQCGRAVVPRVDDVALLADVLVGGRDRVMLVEPTAGIAASTLAALPPLADVAAIVGPEGGWSDREMQSAQQNGAILLTLGALTLRADAVPVVALTALRVRLEDF